MQVNRLMGFGFTKGCSGSTAAIEGMISIMALRLSNQTRCAWHPHSPLSKMPRCMSTSMRVYCCWAQGDEGRVTMAP